MSSLDPQLDNPLFEGPTPNEEIRVNDLLRLFPGTASEVLEIGARDGMITALLAQRYPRVIALDLEKPTFQIARCEPVQGNVCALDFPNASMDFILCTEVLEHVPDLVQACRELERVTKRFLLVGVPYLQDTRLGRTTCRQCGKVNPPWGHVNEFTKEKLVSLFPGLRPAEISLIGSKRAQTNALSTALMDVAGNPWGMYIQQEPCIHCGAKLVAPASMTFLQRVAAAISVRLTRLQTLFVPKTALWIHVLFERV